MELFKLFGTIAINNQSAMNTISATAGAVGSLAQKTGHAFVTAGSVVAKGVAVSATAVSALMKKSIGNFKEYEQLVGGVETLFKNSASTVMQYANNAWQTAGLSANDYMSTVTSFSASLIQSLKGDTAKAAEVANKALVDMADNANKMGTSMGSIQDAYQGFAKQNYTMLDNLKLGYGGTKTEMQRLLKDAQKIKKAQGENTKYSIDSFADIVEAIHVVQEEMGITGTTAEEAAETIGGSLQATGAAWQNLLTGIASGNQDLGVLIDNFSSSLQTSLENITKILPNITQGFQQVIQDIAPQLGGIFEEIFPVVLDGAIALIGGLVDALPGMLTTLGQSIGKVWSENVWPAIREFFKINFGFELPEWAVIETYIQGAWPALKTNIENLCTWTLKLFDNPTEAIGDVSTAFSSWWTSTGEPGLKKASTWALQLFGVPIEDDATIVDHIGAWWNLKVDTIAGACNWVLRLFGVPEETADKITETVSGWWKGVVDTVVGACNWILQQPEFPSVAKMCEAVGDWWNKEIVPALPELWASVKVNIRFFYHNLITGLGTAFNPNTKVTIGEDGHRYINGETSPEIDAISSPTIAALTDGQFGAPAPAAQETVNENAKGAVFSKATIFDTRLGKQMVGEAGPEAVAPIGVLQGYVADAVNDSNNQLAPLLAKVLEELRAQNESMEERLINAFASMQFNVNNREFARMVKAVVT